MRNFYLLSSLLSIFLLSACNNNVDQELIEQTADEPEKTELNQVGIPAGTIDLSLSDAVMVAQLYRNKDKATRGEINKSVKNVVPIPGKDGNPAIYAVNFEDGYLLISATKLLPPVLGEVDHGTYDPSHKGETGEEVIISELIETIEYKRANCKAEENEYRTSWYPYLESTDPGSNIKTRAMDDNEYWNALDSWYGNYDTSDRDRCRVFLFNGGSDLISEDDWNYIYESYLYDQDPWWNTDYKWENTAYIVMENYDETVTVGPLVGTNWYPYQPFNTTGFNDLGCATIAVGQIMRFFEYPTTFNWGLMPTGVSITSQATPATKDFLSTLRNKLIGPVNQTNVSIDKAKSVLEDYGYNVRKTNHSPSEILYQIRYKKKPVYARGVSKTTSEGHAWVIDGIRDSHYGTTFKLYYLDPDYYPNFVYREEVLQLSGSNGRQSTYFHMNWGNVSNKDGWYSDDTINTSSNSEINYSHDRKELIINM